MITAREYLNKIKWDKREVPEDTFIYYYDRVKDCLNKIEYKYILKIEDGFMETYNDENEIVDIPIHRIRMIKRKNKLLWRRK